jgi:diguanylate cyclase (GGDEF)-like protein
MMAVMGDVRTATPAPGRLLAIIELQNAIAAAALSADEIMRVVCERAATLVGATGGMVGLVEGDEIACKAATGAMKSALGTRLPKAWSLAGRCIAERKPQRADNTQTDARVDPETRTRTGAESMVCVPLLYGEHAVGVLELMSTKAHAFTDEDVATLPILAEIVSIAVHRALTYPKPRLDHLHDTVTGIGNRRAYDERIEAELARNRRYGHSFSLAMVRLVGLESVVDRAGQQTADELLKEVAGILEQHSRAIDACFRIAANELAIVMPGTSLEGAGVLADRVRAHITGAKLGDGHVRLSIGVVAAADETAPDLTARAHAALDGGADR